MSILAEGRGGGVASGHPLAASAGLAALDEGGSSVDAALAMAFAQWVVSSPMCGPGGELFVMHVAADRAMVYGGWARTPLAFPPGGPITARGPKAAVVPGAVRGAEAAWRAGGRLPWRRLFDSAVTLAGGHEVTDWMARSYRSVVERGKSDALAAVTGAETAPAAGDTVRVPELGQSLEQVANEGPDAMYTGELAKNLVEASEADGAFLRHADLDSMAADVVEADECELEDLTLMVPPPPSQAGITADLLRAARPGSDAGSRDFAREVAELTRDKLIEKCVAGLGGTAASVAADRDGAAVVVHSLAGVQYGTGWVAGDTGIALGNRVGTCLSTRADLPASNPQPGQMLMHTLSAAWLTTGGRSMLVATPGGDRQVQWLAQAGQRFRQGKSLHDILTGPRWFVCPEGDRFGVPGGIGKEWFMFGEAGVEWSDDRTVASFAVRPVESAGGGLQAVVVERDGSRHFGSDPRGAGDALTQGDA